VAYVIHCSGLHGAARCGEERAAVEVARRSRARRRACWRVVLGIGTGAQGLVRVRVQKKGEPRLVWGWAVPQRHRRGGAAATERRGWCSGHQIGLHVPTACAKGREVSGSAHRGSDSSSVAVQGGRRRGPAAEVGQSSRRSRRKGFPGSWSPWFGAWWSCKGTTVVRAVQNAPAAWSLHGGSSSPELPAVQFPATQRVGVEIGAS